MTSHPGNLVRTAETKGMRYDAFLSYSSSDLPAVRRVQRFLESYVIDRGKKSRVRVFLDQTDIRGGALRPEIEAALAASALLIVCCSEAAAESRWVDAEIQSYEAMNPAPNIALVLIRGEPENVIPAAARALEPRYHDLRGAWVTGFLTPRARDELLRLLALVTGRDLRTLINWDRRRTILQIAVGSTAVATSVSGVAWYVQSKRRIRPADVTAKVSYEPLVERVDRKFLDLFRTDVTLKLFGADAPRASDGQRRWPQSGSRFSDRAELRLTSVTQTAADLTHPTVDGTSYTSIRTFSAFDGLQGPFERPSRWSESTFDARLEAIVPFDQWPSRSGWEHEENETKSTFDEYYGITSADRDSWLDYSVSPLPIGASLELMLGGNPIGMAKGYVAHVREHDEDVRGLHVVYFPPFGSVKRKH